MIVLDASAMLAFLFGETGHERVAEALLDSVISTVNLAEVLGRFTRDGVDAQALAPGLKAQGVQCAPFSETQAALAAAMVPHTRRHGLSLGDRACLALAQERSLPVLTADRVWTTLDLGVDVITIR